MSSYFVDTTLATRFVQKAVGLDAVAALDIKLDESELKLLTIDYKFRYTRLQSPFVFTGKNASQVAYTTCMQLFRGHYTRNAIRAKSRRSRGLRQSVAAPIIGASKMFQFDVARPRAVMAHS